jgi:hypothetical protein
VMEEGQIVYVVLQDYIADDGFWIMGIFSDFSDAEARMIFLRNASPSEFQYHIETHDVL